MDSWKSSISTDIKRVAAGVATEVTLPGALTMTTKPTRDADPTAGISLTVGAVSCQASDAR